MDIFDRLRRKQASRIRTSPPFEMSTSAGKTVSTAPFQFLRLPQELQDQIIEESIHLIGVNYDVDVKSRWTLIPSIPRFRNLHCNPLYMANKHLRLVYLEILTGLRNKGQVSFHLTISAIETRTKVDVHTISKCMPTAYMQDVTITLDFDRIQLRSPYHHRQLTNFLRELPRLRTLCWILKKRAGLNDGETSFWNDAVFVIEMLAVDRPPTSIGQATFPELQSMVVSEAGEVKRRWKRATGNTEC